MIKLEVVEKRVGLKYHFSPLRYPGGKTFLFPLIDRVIKRNSINDTVYVEPYAGGAGAGLALLCLEKVEKVVINDLDKGIYSFWKSIIYDTDRFIQKLEKIPVSIEERKKQQKIYFDKKSKLFDKGFAAFYLNRTNVSGVLNGGPIGGKEQKGKWKIDARFNKTSLIKRILDLERYKNRITILNMDGLDVIKRYIKDKNALIYIDPPYYEKGATLYLNHFIDKNHKQLAVLLNQNKNYNWLLTYDENNRIRELYNKRKIVNFTIQHRAFKSKQGKEVMIFSDGLLRA